MKKGILILGLGLVLLSGSTLAQAGEGCGAGACGAGKEKGASMKGIKYDEVTLKIDDMHCGDCEKTIKDALSTTDGVKVCSIRLKDKTAKVCYDKKKISLDKIVKRIQKEGFSSKEIKEAKVKVKSEKS